MMCIIGKQEISDVPSAKTGKVCSNLRNLVMWVSICLLLVPLSSCTTFYFEQPIPVDRPGVKRFPNNLIGTWQPLKDSGASLINIFDSKSKSSGYNTIPFRLKRKTRTQSADYFSNDSLSLVVEETFFTVIVISNERIVKGAWPRLNAEKHLVYPSNEPYEFEDMIIYDSLRQPVDTVQQYIFRNSKMYDIDPDGTISAGRSYWQEQDTFVMKSIDTLYFDLGNNVVLRQLNDRFYAMNIRGGLAGNQNNWWQLYIIEKKADNIFSTWEFDEIAKELPFLVYQYKHRMFYMDAAFTTTELLQLLKSGYFVETDVYYLKR